MKKKAYVFVVIAVALCAVVVFGTHTTEASRCDRAAQSIEVTSPNGREVFTDGQRVKVTWVSCNVSKRSIIPFYLEIYDTDNNYLGHIGLGSSVNDGMEISTLPTLSYLQQDPQFKNVVAGAHFKISLVATDNINALTVPDDSNNWFSIQEKKSVTSRCRSTSAPTITVFSPKGGEVYMVGDLITVRWSSCNIPATENITIEIESGTAPRDFSQSINTVLGTTPNDGVETFIVPTFPQYGKLFRMSMRSDIVGSYQTNDGTEIFTINDVTSDCTASTNPSVTVLSPNGGEMYALGESMTIKWKSCNIPDDTLLEINIYNSDPAVFGFLAPNGTVNDGIEVISTESLVVGSKYEIIVGTPVDGFNNSALDISDKSDEHFTINHAFWAGCTSYNGLSTITGIPCNTSSSYDRACITGHAYSSTDGLACNPLVD